MLNLGGPEAAFKPKVAPPLLDDHVEDLIRVVRIHVRDERETANRPELVHFVDCRLAAYKLGCVNGPITNAKPIDCAA